MGVEIRRKASWTSCLRGKLTQHLSPLCPIQGLIFSQQTWGWHPESPQTRKELHGRGREDTSGSLRRLAFVSSDKKKRIRKCYRATVWREWGTKWRKQANAADRHESDSAQASSYGWDRRPFKEGLHWDMPEISLLPTSAHWYQNAVEWWCL